MKTANLLNIFVPVSTPARASVDFSTFVLAIIGFISDWQPGQLIDPTRSVA